MENKMMMFQLCPAFSDVSLFFFFNQPKRFFEMHNFDMNIDLTLLFLLLIFSCNSLLFSFAWSQMELLYSFSPGLDLHECDLFLTNSSKEKNLPVWVQLILNLETGCSQSQDEEWQGDVTSVECITVWFKWLEWQKCKWLCASPFEVEICPRRQWRN